MSYQDSWKLFDNDMNNLLEALKGNAVLCGLAVSQKSGGADMSVDVGKGRAVVNKIFRTKSSVTNLAIAASNPTDPRKDIIVMDSNGTLSVVTGSVGAADPPGETGPATKVPIPPNIPANKILLAEVWVGAGVAQINDVNITDRRILRKGLRTHHRIGKVYGDTLILDDGKYKSWGRTLADWCAKTLSERRVEPYETYEWKAKTTPAPPANALVHIGSLEEVPSPAEANRHFIFLYYTSAGTHTFKTGDGVGTQSTSLSGQDWTTERTFKVEWTASKVELFVDGVSKANHTTRVPSERLLRLIETVTTGTAPAVEFYLEADQAFLEFTDVPI